MLLNEEEEEMEEADYTTFLEQTIALAASVQGQPDIPLTWPPDTCNQISTCLRSLR